jgi:hypothetical protein
MQVLKAEDRRCHAALAEALRHQPRPRLGCHLISFCLSQLRGAMQVMLEVTSAALSLDQDPQVKAIILTGEGPKAFAAGADIKEMAPLSYSQASGAVLLFREGCMQLC